MAEQNSSDGLTSLGHAIFVTNKYKDWRAGVKGLRPLPNIVEIEKAFSTTFDSLGFSRANIVCVTKTALYDHLEAVMSYIREVRTVKYIVFFFIGHGGNGDVLYMERGEEVGTDEIFEILKKSNPDIPKVVFIDACRGKEIPHFSAPPNFRVYRSTLPNQPATYGGTALCTGDWSRKLLPLLQVSQQSLHNIVKAVDAEMDMQVTHIDDLGVREIYWRYEANQLQMESPGNYVGGQNSGSNDTESMELSARETPELTLSKSSAEFSCEDCHSLQVHLCQIFGIQAEIICWGTVEYG